MKHHNKCVLISPLLNYNTGFISITFSDPFGPSNTILKLEIVDGVDVKFMHVGATSWNHINFCVKHLGQTSLLTLLKLLLELTYQLGTEESKVHVHIC